MSRQWGHGFHQGKKAQVLDGLTRRKEYGIDRWIFALRDGEVIFRRDWDSDSKRLFMRNGVLLVCEDGITKLYEIGDLDMQLEWFGFADCDDIEAYNAEITGRAGGPG